MSLMPKHSPFDFSSLLDFFHPSSKEDNDSEQQLFAPRIDIEEGDERIMITAELPGVKKEDIHISFDKGVLTLEAESKKESSEEKDGKIIRQERRYGRIIRSVHLGDLSDDNEIQAQFKNGLLKITAPKREQLTTERRRIDIT